MIEARMDMDALETTYDVIADAMDDVGPDRRDLFLAKLVLVLSNYLGDPAQVQAAISAAKRDIA